MSRPGSADDLLTTADAARILGLSADMVRLLAREGRLPAVAETVRGLRLFRQEDVEALAAERAGQKTHHHIVQFYEHPESLTRVVSDFLAEGLRSRGPVLVIATRERQQAVLERLSCSGHDVEQARASGQLTLLEARETLDRFMVKGIPDAKRFRTYLRPLIDARRPSRHPRLRVYGEMVDLLCRDGLIQGALRFEKLWNDLARGCCLSRLCTYSIDHFGTSSDAPSFQRVCDLHTRVHPTERYCESADPVEQLRRIALLEQQARALRAEMERSRLAEQALHAMRPARHRASAAAVDKGAAR